jgi:glycosyltransferase involved in cell wall biosynthesis
MKIDIVVQGRFHLFDMALAWLEQGQDVVVHTNYPGRVAGHFGLPRTKVRSFVPHGVAARIAGRLPLSAVRDQVEARLHTWFGTWAAGSVRPDSQLVIGMSGVMEEVLNSRPTEWKGVAVVSRGSSHIRFQDEVLRGEEERAGTAVPRPTKWMIAREEREYAKADLVAVLSTFARDSFIAAGVSPARLVLHPLGVNLRTFHASEETLAERVSRIRSGGKLRILTVGSFSFRKGALDLVHVAERLSDKMEFRFVGDTPAEASELADRARDHISFVPRVPEGALTGHYAWADIFLFPTIEDGFAAVLMQAAAAGLPVLATRNCSGPDIIREGHNGWIVDIRDPGAITSRLMRCDEQREGLARMIRVSAKAAGGCGWSVVCDALLGDLKARFPMLEPRSATD